MSQLDTSTKSSFVVDTLTSYIRKALNDALHASAHKYNSTCDISTIILEYPANSEHGDFSSNCALMYAKKIGIAPKVLAEEIIAHEGCVELTTKYGIHIQVAGHGFINFHIPEDFIYKAIAEILDKGSAGNFGKRNFDAKKKILIEYTDPNPFKVFHIGHLMANALGESLSRLLEYSGAHIIRANYQGDVGLHVAKALWAMRNEIGASGQQYGGFPNITHESAHWIGEMYVKGSGAYDNDEEINGKKARAEIAEINKKIFDRSDESIILYMIGVEK